MKKENIIWLAVGGLAVYLFLQSRKKATAQPAEVKEATPTPTPTPIPNMVKEKIFEGGLGVSPAKKSDQELKLWYTNVYCKRMFQKRQLSQIDIAYQDIALSEIAKRGLRFDCGMFLKPYSPKDRGYIDQVLALNPPRKTLK
jgi:hypothetical protein